MKRNTDIKTKAGAKPCERTRETTTSAKLAPLGGGVVECWASSKAVALISKTYDTIRHPAAMIRRRMARGGALGVPLA